MSSLSAGRLRSGSLNGQALLSGPLSFADSDCCLAAAISALKTSARESTVGRLKHDIRRSHRITFNIARHPFDERAE